MSVNLEYKRVYPWLVLLLAALVTMLANTAYNPAAAAPAATPLTFVNVAAPDVNCLFDGDCTIYVEDVTAGIALTTIDGAGFLQSRLWPRGEAGTDGVGLFPYLYRIDLRQMDSEGNPGCITSMAVDFGPIMPLDYDDNGSLEHGFIITDGGVGSVTPSAVSKDGNQLIFDFSPPVCSTFYGGDGESSFFFGLASPFQEQAVTAVLQNNVGDPLDVPARAPDYASGPTLTVVPGSGAAGDVVQLIGSGYTPGGYDGAIRWNGSDDGTLTIPSGGAFTVPYTIPAGAGVAVHTITVCSLHPCATGEFEQLASAAYAVTAAQPPGPYRLYLPVMAQDAPTQPEPFSYVVDPDVQPVIAELPGLDGGAARPVTAVRAPNGEIASFVANEIVVQTNDTGALNALLAQTGGAILLEMDPAANGVTGLPKTYLLRVNPASGDPAGLVADMTALQDPAMQTVGEYAFGSSSGVGVMALAADAANGGLTVGVNWVSDTAAIPVDSDEAANGPIVGGIVYDPDAYNWSYMARGTTQDIGVPEAWTLLARGGKLGNRVDIAILDGGFYPNADFPAGTTFLNVFPFDPRNVDGVDGSAPFHGTDVLQTAVARSDNDSGIVGVAAPIGRPIALYTSYDFAVGIASVLMARGAGAEIINMSYSANVPSIFGFTVLPFEATTAAVRASGTLLFASAGNDGRNVDGEDCFLRICWEHTWHTPCENAGVICVGGIGWNSKNRAGNSNFGPEHVDIFAPYTVYRGQAPDNMGGTTTVATINGTSFSSPYAASVAALIWAADPSLSAGEVWAILRDTAHTSPDGRVNRYVNAYAAVLEAVGVGLDVTLTSPVGGADYDQGYPLRMAADVGFVSVADSASLQVQWYVDGALHTTTSYTPGAGSHLLYPEAYAHNLSAGSHTVRVRVSVGGTAVERSATFTVTNTAPAATIDQPASGSAFCPGETITFRGSSFDVNEWAGLPNTAYAWQSSINGSLGVGATRNVSTLTSGSHTITLRVTDGGGLWDEDTINLTIRAASDPACEDLDPTATILSPDDGYVVYADTWDGSYWVKQVTFTGEFDDVEDPNSALTVQWYSDRQGYLGTGSINNSTGITTLTTNMRAYDSCGTTHVITLRVTDSAGNPQEDQIEIFIGLLC